MDSTSVNQDELILQQQRQIEKEISDSIPLVSEPLPVNCLNNEYSDDQIYLSKIENLAGNYKAIRRTRPDGNCFFRAFAYAYLEYLAHNQEEYERFYILARDSKDKLVGLGFPKFTIEDFHDTFMEVIQKVKPLAKEVNADAGNRELLDELHKVINEQGVSDYVVVYLRLITSGQLQEGADFYQNFIEGCSMEEFRHQEVEPMYKESDHIHIIAISTALNVGIRVEYMDRGEQYKDGQQTKTHDFPEDTKPKVFLLYRPGHYDILYPK